MFLYLTHIPSRRIHGNYSQDLSHVAATSPTNRGADDGVAEDSFARQFARQRTESHDSAGSTEAHLRLYRTGSFDMETVTANEDGTSTSQRVMKSGGHTTISNNGDTLST
jgi:hypothetical protein